MIKNALSFHGEGGEDCRLLANTIIGISLGLSNLEGAQGDKIIVIIIIIRIILIMIGTAAAILGGRKSRIAFTCIDTA